MSEISHSDELVTKQDLSNFYQGILPYLGGMPEGGYTPVGTIISVMGNSAPEHYLACNGQTVAIVDYPELASYFEEQFGSKSKFGGDGTTTFGIPDLRGEFLRGAGANGHANCGGGLSVGSHQNPTRWHDIKSDSNNTYITDISSKSAYANAMVDPDYVENTDASAGRWSRELSIKSTTRQQNVAAANPISVRPTNTSVLYCIATKNIYMSPMSDYSTTEKVIGRWIDGKPIYQKTFNATTPSTALSNDDIVTHGLSIDTVVSIKGIVIKTEYNGKYYWDINTVIGSPTSYNGDMRACWVRPNTIAMKVSDGATNLPVIITLQYTKSN